MYIKSYHFPAQNSPMASYLIKKHYSVYKTYKAYKK
jgi:hypothetical protein